MEEGEARTTRRTRARTTQTQTHIDAQVEEICAFKRKKNQN